MIRNQNPEKFRQMTFYSGLVSNLIYQALLKENLIDRLLKRTHLQNKDLP